MTIKEVSYLKQSKSNTHLVLLNSYTVRINTDFSKIFENKEYSYSSTKFEKTAFPVVLRIAGMSYYNAYDKFSKIFCEKLNLFQDIKNLPFPVAVRAINKDTYVIERPPFKTSVRLSLRRAYLSKHLKDFPVLCEIWIPWTVSILKLRDESFGSIKPSMKMYYNDGPLSSLDEPLSPSWTPNMHGSGEMCLGDTLNNFEKEVSSGNLNPNNVQEVYNYLINDYFNGGWNMDLGGGLIENLCNNNIGKFTRNPLNNPELILRAKKNKLKFKMIDDSSRKSTVVKTNYLTWSLLTLSEVLEAVKLYKETFNEHYIARYTLNTIIASNDTEFNNEHQSLKYVARKMQENYEHMSKNWEINLKISSEIIDKVLHEQYSFEELEKLNVANFGHTCAFVARNIIYKDYEIILPLINNALDSIADICLDSNYEDNLVCIDPIHIEYNCEKESVAL